MPVPLLLLMLVTTTSGPFVQSQRVDTSTVVITSGIGEVSLTPDRAILRINVETRDTSAAGATIKNNTRLKRVVDSLTAIRLPQESIQVVAVTVRPNENMERGEVVGYQAAAIVRVAIRSLDRLGKLLDVAVRAGATGIEDVEFHSDREDAARRDALGIAFGEARANAGALAKAAGLELGPLVQVSTEPDYGRRFGGFALSSVQVSGYSGVPIEPKDIKVTASVTATWRLVVAARR